MFGLGFSEIMIVALVVLVFVRPDELPKLIRWCGQVYGQIMYAFNDVIQDIKQSDRPK